MSVRSDVSAGDEPAIKLDRASSTVSAEEMKSNNLAKLRIQRLISPDQVKDLQPITLGEEGAHKYGVTTARGKQYFAKLCLLEDEVLESAVCEEIATSIWAAKQGLAPAVIGSDTERGSLITEFLTNEMTDWHQEGGKEPRLSATLATLLTLHESKPPVEHCRYQSQEAATCWKEDYVRTDEQTGLALHEIPAVVLAGSVVGRCIERLLKNPYDAVPCHGDLYQENVIFNSGRAWFIDWSRLEHADPMKELAYYAFHTYFGVGQFQLLLKKYDSSLSVEKIERANCHLATIVSIFGNSAGRFQ